MSQKYEKLKTLLKELFQLDQPDLDFGLYRIMHAKSAEVTQFLDRDLLPQVKQSFARYKSADKADLEKELAKVRAQAEAIGVAPETLPKVKDLLEKLAHDAVDIDALESEVYDHLFTFFRRYYSEGDFLAKRVYKPGVYAIPYEGEEVKLHWANRDQYYIKTGEYLRDYTFCLRPDNEERPMRVHFRLVDAAEGEHGNVKAAEGKDRSFLLAPSGESGRDYVTLESADLSIRFEYRQATLADWPDNTRQGRTKPPVQKDLIDLAMERVLTVADSSLTEWVVELKRPDLPGNPDRTILEKHLWKYCHANEFDYFIHKDLGGFLRTELDFYIKNEVMHLDDVESESAPRVEQILSKLKIIRQIAGKIIDFLAQLEDFQKKIWLKRKFVTETHYCVTLDRIDEALYSEIAASEAQRKEWVELIAINEIAGDLNIPAYSEPLTTDFLKAHGSLMVDTRHFRGTFAERLLNSMRDLDTGMNGVLFHGDNFNVLTLIQKTLAGSVTGIYIDPPYNTDASPIIYKNGYQHSSWISLFADRMSLAQSLLRDCGLISVAIDDFEYPNLFLLMADLGFSHIGTAVVRSKPQGRPTTSGFSANHEYAVFWSSSEAPTLGRLPRKGSKAQRYPCSDDKGIYTWANFRKSGTDSDREDRRKSYYPVYVKDSNARLPSMEWAKDREIWVIKEEPLPGETAIWPVDSDGREKVWTCSADRLRVEIEDLRVVPSSDGTTELQKKYRPNQEGALPGTWWDSPEYSASESGTKVLKDLFGSKDFDFPKSINLVVDNLRVLSTDSSALFLDYFGGSGTTACAVIELNREDKGHRRYVLAEQGDYFDSVLTPRIKKMVFSSAWKGGRPTSAASGVSHAFKTVKLESYEDALNNLEVARPATQQALLDLPAAGAIDGLKEQYTLRYMLNVETRGSQSLLNLPAFTDPTAYKLRVKRPGSDESRAANVDLLETFNWLIGLTVQHIGAPQSFKAEFERDGENRLVLKGRWAQEPTGPWWFRKVEGRTPDGRKTLIVWRKLTGDPERDNLMLDVWMKDRLKISTTDFEFDLIYVNGDNNLENLRQPDDTWKVRLIEEDFHRLMFDTEGL